MLRCSLICSDWFRQETLDDSLQPTIDMLLNFAIFLWFGATCPWHLFTQGSIISTTRLCFLGICVLLLRRPPVLVLLHGKIHQIHELRQALFVGFFGPIGVSAIFYLYLTLEFLDKTALPGDKEVDSELQRLGETMTVVVWFLVICSVVSQITVSSIGW